MDHGWTHSINCFVVGYVAVEKLGMDLQVPPEQELTTESHPESTKVSQSVIS